MPILTDTQLFCLSNASKLILFSKNSGLKTQAIRTLEHILMDVYKKSKRERLTGVEEKNWVLFYPKLELKRCSNWVFKIEIHPIHPSFFFLILQ